MIPSQVGGTETYLIQTLLHIARHQPDVNLILFTNAENDPVLRERLDGFSQIEYVNLGFAASNRYSRIIREQTQLPGCVRRASPDVLWSPGYTAAFFSPCPQVVTIHDMQYKRYPHDFPFLNLIVTDVLVRIAARRCKRIIAVSEFSKSEIVRFTGADAGIIDVTHEAANPAFGEKRGDHGRKQALTKLGLDSRPYILCVSNTYPHKNMDLLVEAFGAISQNIPHQLVFIGRPRLGEAAVHAALDKLPDKSRFSRLEYVDYADLPTIYQSAAVFAFPSLYEGFGLPVLEAMMAGAPVVTTREASIPELGGDCVLYANGKSATDLSAKLLEATRLTGQSRLDLCTRAAARAHTFSWEKTAAATVASLRKAICQ